jgi:hypothetical protein
LVSDRDRDNPDSLARAGREAISAVKLPEQITAAVDAWAEARHITRSEAICQLIELGLNVTPHRTARTRRLDPNVLEDAAVRQIGELLDPALTPDERERRIRRLIEGPPEFTAERIDLPKHET